MMKFVVAVVQRVWAEIVFRMFSAKRVDIEGILISVTDGGVAIENEWPTSGRKHVFIIEEISNDSFDFRTTLPPYRVRHYLGVHSGPETVIAKIHELEKICGHKIVDFKEAVMMGEIIRRWIELLIV